MRGFLGKNSFKAKIMENYYRDQLEKIKVPLNLSGVTLQIRQSFEDTSSNTNWLGLNQESATEIVKWLTDNFNVNTEPKDTISIVWSLEDIYGQAQNAGAILTEDEARDILKALPQIHDASIGINWDVIDSLISEQTNGLKWETMTFLNSDWNCRVIADMDNEDSTLLIAPEALNIALTSEFGDNIQHSDYRAIDEQICYYASPEEMLLTDEDLFNLIYN